MNNKKTNYAFIDGQNLYLNVVSQGWKLDYIKFRKYLSEKYAVNQAYMFLGFLPQNKKLYDFLISTGYNIVFKPKVVSGTKGNCDVELTVEAIIKKSEYDKSILVTGDGDFFYLARYLHEIGKLEKVLVPDGSNYSKLFHEIEHSSQSYVAFISNLRNRLEYK